MRLGLAAIALGCACGGGNTVEGVDAAPNDGAVGDATPSIDAPPVDPGPTNVRLTLVDRPNSPASFDFIVAYQDGDGDWTAAPAPSGDTYQFSIASGRFGYAWTCHTAGSIVVGNTSDLRFVKLGFYSTDEHTALVERVPAGCTEQQQTTQLTGAVAHRNFNDRYFATWGEVSAGVDQLGNYNLAVTPGTHDLIVSHVISGGTVNDAIVDSSVVVRDVTVGASGATRNVDFATSVKALTFPVTVVTTGSQRASTTTTLVTASGTALAMVRDTQGPFETNALAVAQARVTDVYAQDIAVVSGAATAITSNATTTPAAITFVAPAPLGAASSSTVSTDPYPQIKTSWQAYPTAIGYRWTAVQQLGGFQCGTITNGCVIAWTADIGAGSGAHAFQMPDLSEIEGWSANLQFVTGTAIIGDAQAFTSTAGSVDFPLEIPAPGTKRVIVRTAWTTTPAM